MVKHTPGPWSAPAMSTSFSEAWNHSPFAAVYAEHTGHHICSCDGNFKDANNIANARLIAAAPELLEALEGILAVASVRIDDPRIKQWDAARAAIAKAKGEIARR